MSHIDEGLLHAHLDGALGPDEQLVWTGAEAHLEVCADCRRRLAEARRLRDAASSVLAGADTPSAARPAFETVLSEAARRAGDARETGLADAASDDVPPAVPPLARRPPWWRSTIRLAWAASVVLALGAGWIGRTLLEPMPDPVPDPVPAEPGVLEEATARDAVSGGQRAERPEAAQAFRADAADEARARQREDSDGGFARQPEIDREGEPLADATADRAGQANAPQAAAVPDRAECYAATADDRGSRPADAVAEAQVGAGSLLSLRLNADGTATAVDRSGSLVGFWEPLGPDAIGLRLSRGDGWSSVRLRRVAGGLEGTDAATAEVVLRPLGCEVP